MANLWMQSFGVATSNTTTRGMFDGGASATYSETSGRRGGGCLMLSHGAYVYKNLSSSEQELIIGFAYNRQTGSQAWTLVEFTEGTNSHIFLRMNSDFTLSVVKGGTGTVLGTSSRTIIANEWVFIELRAKISTTLGSFDLRMNGVTQASGSDLNTRNASSSVDAINRIYLGAGANSDTSYISRRLCDLYLNNTTVVSGSSCHTFLGPIRVEYLPAAAEGFYKQFTPSTGTNRAATVDDTGILTSDNNYSSTAGQMDTYTLATLPAIAGGSVVYAVAQKAVIAKTDAGYLDAALMLRDGSTSTDLVSSTVVQPNTTDTFFTQTYELNPFTTVGWTGTDIANLQTGVKVVAV